MTIEEAIAASLSLPLKQVQAAVTLLDEGNTVPFIARYRKEVTGGLDDTVLRKLVDTLTTLRNLEARKAEVRDKLIALEKWSEALQTALDNATTVTEVEDIYRPYRPKKRTRASMAKERGLEPLALLILAQKKSYKPSLAEVAKAYISPEKEVHTAEEALQGAADILAEMLTDAPENRQLVREMTMRQGQIHTVLLTDAASSPYAQYADHTEPLAKIPSHRVLAINRGEREEALRVTLVVDRERILQAMCARVLVRGCDGTAGEILTEALSDGYDRLLAPSLERELRGELTAQAEEGAIHNFAMNLKNLLLTPPLKGKTVLGLDPGYRTGCKLAVLSPTGAVLETAVIYPTKPHERIEEARRTVLRLIQKYQVDVVSIGNGTASGESEQFIAETIGKADHKVQYSIVSEAGASVYSASELGAEEFPELDVTERSAVSIGRRLQDPLAELVKIEPRSIGVGQYQHDMRQTRLAEALSGVVEDCVNAVGVDLNTASAPLLSYIAGLNKTTAKNIVKYREENGGFTSRAAVKKVPRFGAKAYEQAAGFLRVPGAKEVLDNTGVHPESYPIAKALCARFGYTEADIGAGGLGALRQQAEEVGLSALAAALGCGVPTLTDIIGELEKPGRDIRDTLPTPLLREKVMTLDDIEEGQTFTGTVRNVVDFGAFVDIGIHQDGLIHISALADRYIRHPSEVVAVGDTVQVEVVQVDRQRGRIGLRRITGTQSKS